jgi:hypothetical protein
MYTHIASGFPSATAQQPCSTAGSVQGAHCFWTFCCQLHWCALAQTIILPSCWCHCVLCFAQDRATFKTKSTNQPSRGSKSDARTLALLNDAQLCMSAEPYLPVRVGGWQAWGWHC